MILCKKKKQAIIKYMGNMCEYITFDEDQGVCKLWSGGMLHYINVYDFEMLYRHTLNSAVNPAGWLRQERYPDGF
jgi:hypothetical protein